MNNTFTSTTTNDTTTSSGSRRPTRLQAMFATAVATVAIVMATINPASAATGRWYGIPAAYGANASVNMTYFSKTYASGSAGGQIWLKNVTGANKVYVQFKPNEGGTWNRGTQNVTQAGTAYYFNWSDSFTLNYSGFMFRICKDQFGPDPCGSAVKVYG